MDKQYELVDLKSPENDESSDESGELSHSDYVKYLIDTQGRAMVPKQFHGKKYKTKKLKDRYTGPYKWMYRQFNHSQDKEKNFDFWKKDLPAEYRHMKSDGFYDLVEKVKNDEDRGIVENFRDLEAVNDFIKSLEAYSPSARGGKSRKITKRRHKHRRKHRRTKRNTFLN